MPLDPVFPLKKAKVLLLGSGALSIGQAGEFDYSGTQAIKAFLDQGLEVVLVNPNIATVQTNPQPHCKVYLYPVTAEWVTEVIRKEKPQALVAGFGGQTALNCAIELERRGVLAEYGVKNLGTPVSSLCLTEDRNLFAQAMAEIGVPTPPCRAEKSVEGALASARDIGYPVILRSSFALGGLGSGFARNDQELEELASKALQTSPEILVEKSLKGFKEIEYEVMRDSFDNVITICNMENFDPLGVHTGDSIVIVPSQTLSNDEYQILRDASIRIVRHLKVVGECNVQLTLDPKSLQFYVIEVNARLSRSSALASKASGYPIAYIAAQVVLGFSLLELKNPVTKTTSAFFEPSLDYVILKIPKWDLGKFPRVSSELGTAMKSVGEIMSIGRNFQEVLQKALRMSSDENSLRHGKISSLKTEKLWNLIETPNDQRLWVLLEAFRRDFSLQKIHQASGIDLWFLAELQKLVEEEKKIELRAFSFFESQKKGNQVTTSLELLSLKSLTQLLASWAESLSREDWLHFKRLGFSDQALVCEVVRSFARANSTSFESSENGRASDSSSSAASASDSSSSAASASASTSSPASASASAPVPTLTSSQWQDWSLLFRQARLKKQVRPWIKKIDTTSAEAETPSNYLYFTYEALTSDVEVNQDAQSFLVLGSGAYRIGSSVEFDWCAVTCSEVLRKQGHRSLMINCNPETVSTDYNSSDRLYFEELTLERILDLIDFEKPAGVIVSMGGQTPNNLAAGLEKAGVQILGHSAEVISLAEDRHLFSELLKQISLDQPRFTQAKTREEITNFIDQVRFPILVRPSHVLSGTAMRVASSRESLEKDIEGALDVGLGKPVLLTEFLEEAREIELDGVAQQGKMLVGVVSEHLENAGVHSGDAIHVLPPLSLTRKQVDEVKFQGAQIVSALKLNGPFNIQFLLKENLLKVIECNSRASRSFPFVSKVTGINLAELATRVFLDHSLQQISFDEFSLPHWGVKSPMFSFKRLEGADPTLGVEMSSTGEAGCVAESFEKALMLALEATGIHRPRKGILISSGRPQDKEKLKSVYKLIEKLELPVYATEGTAQHLRQDGLSVETVPWPLDQKNPVSLLMKEKKVDLVINIPKNHRREEVTNGTLIRQEALRQGCSLITTPELAVKYFEALWSSLPKTLPLPAFPFETNSEAL